MPVEENGKYAYKTPMELISQLSWRYIRAYEMFDKGFLPNGKGWMEESNKYVQSMQLVSNEFIRCQNEKSKSS
jgi:hypothetical protein